MKMSIYTTKAMW